MRITLVPRGDAAPGLCPYCRDPVPHDARDVAGCPRCGVRLHRECHGQLVRCPSIGCLAPVRHFTGVRGVIVGERFEVYQQLGRERYGMTVERAARLRQGAWVMHPGPFNRGLEIDGAVADGERSLILKQVAAGPPVRMAVLHACVYAG